MIRIVAPLVVAAFLAVSPVSAARQPTIPRRVSALLGLKWTSLTIDRVVEMEPLADVDAEVSASVGAGYDCAPIRDIRFVQTVTQGECVRCLHLEFQRSGANGPYILSAIIFDYLVSSRVDAQKLLQALLSGAGLHNAAVDLPEDEPRSSQWNGRWTVPDEMRALDIVVVQRRDGWHFHFDHRRSHVEGVLASPP